MIDHRPKKQDWKTLRVWKLVRSARMDDPLSTKGSSLYGGRWNPIGTPVLYCSLALSLAALEALVHLARKRNAHYFAVPLDMPECLLEAWTVQQLPPTWKTLPIDPACQAMGKTWLDSKRSLALAVPSVIVPQESNLLVNPLHPDFAKVKGGKSFPFPFDPRL